jgi:hypothetical protein
MGLGRWILAYVGFDLAVIFGLCVWGAAFDGGVGRATWMAGAFFNWHLLFAFLTVPRARRRARGTLSPPPASVVLARIGEPVR